jgi:ELWxxDGT repeat protein
MRPRLIAEALLSLALAAVPIRAAEVPQLLADINQTQPPPDGLFLPVPSSFIALGGRMLFSTPVSSTDEGVLWSTDGTASGTRMISSTICPHPCQEIRPLGTWRGLALFASARGLRTPDGEIWRSDGTAAGTFRLAGPFPSDPFRYQYTIHPLGDRFFFRVCSDADFFNDCVLFRSDGTRAGTAPFVAAGATVPFLDPHSFALWQDRLVFIAGNDTAQGLWSTDGTPEGTVLLADVQEAEDSPAPVVPTPSRIFFGSGETGQDLWVTDGTPGNARRLAAFAPGSCSPPPRTCDIPDVNSLTVIGVDEVQWLAFREGHGEEIWRSDGTESGTKPVFELPPSQTWGSLVRLPGNRWLVTAFTANQGDMQTLWTADDDFTHAAPLTGCDGGACPFFEEYLSPALPKLFVGRDATHGDEVWITDGTGAGTHLLADVCPGPCPGLHLAAEIVLGSAAGKTFFLASLHDGNADAANDELWVTDGTPGGTHKVKEHVTSGAGFLGNLAFFGFGSQGDEASELWASDGTPAGTRQVAVLQRFAPGSSPVFMPRDGGALLGVYDGSHSALWRSDGTPGGTAALAELPGNRLGYDVLAQVGSLQFFSVLESQSRFELWRTDGTAAGTLRVARLDRGVQIFLQTAWRGTLLFEVLGKGCAFWTSDGTPRGTREILPLPSGQGCATALQATGPRFLFVATVHRGKRGTPQIFSSDGTVAGTREISQIRSHRPEFAYRGSNSVTAGGFTFFPIFLPNGFDAEVWRTDGTAAGTHMAFEAALPIDLFGFRDSLYFTANLANSFTRVLYRVSASGGDPVPLAEIGTADSVPPEFTPVGDRLFFLAANGDGIDLWVTDGTPAGTRRATTPGSLTVPPFSDMAAAGNRVFFSADDGEHGQELWESDGTPGGTRMVWDLNPGGFSSNPANLAVSGDFLFFSADDGQTGAEPWALRLEP